MVYRHKQNNQTGDTSRMFYETLDYFKPGCVFMFASPLIAMQFFMVFLCLCITSNKRGSLHSVCRSLA